MNTLLIATPVGMNGALSKVHTLPSLGVYRLQHFLQKNGFECDIWNTELENMDIFLQRQGKVYDLIGSAAPTFPWMHAWPRWQK